MIPKNLHKSDIIKAIKKIKNDGVPKGRGATKFLLQYNKYYYPTKYVVSQANLIKNNKLLESSDFGGGNEVNSYLRKLGFKIIEVAELGEIRQLSLVKLNRIKSTKLSYNKLIISKENEPTFARIILAREWEGKPQEVREILVNVCESWESDSKVHFILTCGGFVQFKWPENLKDDEIGNPTEPKAIAVEKLATAAQKTLEKILDQELMSNLKQRADYITIGIDSFKVTDSAQKTKNPHIELVFLIDLRNSKYYWTGKSYPNTDQKKNLVRISNLDSHFVNLENLGKIMVLGCHDLNFFHPRVTSEKRELSEWRRSLNSAFRNLAQKHKPVYVLHHPHVTVQTTTWIHARKKMETELKSIRFYASAIRYHTHGSKSNSYDFLDELLKKTKKGNSYDFIIC